MRFITCALMGMLSIALFSCQKELDPNIITDPVGNGGNGGNGSYQPLTPGSWWKYKDSATGNTYTNTIINTTKTINNTVFRGVVSTLTQSDTGYQAAPSPNYFLTQKGISPQGAPFDFLFHYLNDTASVGYNWSYVAGTGNGFTAYHKTTIVERGITVTIAGKTYNNVIHTKLDWSYDIMGTIFDLSDYDFYIAKNVGVIRIRTVINGFGTFIQDCKDLVEYHIQ